MILRRTNSVLTIGLIISSLGNGEYHLLKANYLIPYCILGSGMTTSLISLIANAGQTDQAIATAGNQSLSYLMFNLTEIYAVSYLFRSLGSVIGLSIASTLIQDTLRSTLYKRLSGADVDKV